MTAGQNAHDGLDLRSRVMGSLLRSANPLVRRMVSAGLPTGAPNVLLTVRGRRTGRLRSVPVGIVEFEGVWLVQASYGETGWVANLRQAGEAVVTQPGDRRVRVTAVELGPDEAAAVLQRVLRNYRRSRLLGALVGPSFRPPIGVLTRIGIRIDDTLEEYAAEARRHPLFELRPVNEAGA